jgi:poly(3-hydroxybutyrate) depolymerase
VWCCTGYTGSPSGIETFSELTPVAIAGAVAVAYPEGGPTTVGGFGWASGAGVFATTGVDDVGALGEMLDALIATGCIDPTRVTIAGNPTVPGWRSPARATLASALACPPWSW